MILVSNNAAFSHFLYSYFALFNVNSFLLCWITPRFFIVLCKYDIGGKLIACCGQVFSQVVHPTRQFSGLATTAMFFS